MLVDGGIVDGGVDAGVADGVGTVVDDPAIWLVAAVARLLPAQLMATTETV